MRHSFAMMLSNKMKRITLLMYIKMRPSTNALTTRTAIKPAKRAGSIPPNIEGRKCREASGCWGNLKLPPVQPPAGPKSPGQQPHEREPGPLAEAKRLEELLLRMFNGQRDG